ncbi:MAG: D-glycero-beta-D-manno-heptose 1-phosphate adenylyltransferase [Chitinophagales bacterium]|nr:D-glycero-beta-D-manno-heptose 1-phosphate adenylyltransferase [Chitinophagales bacterium]MDW8393858.1 D-glycero-beta-D-manno-heptose 1-phosphate adenylyltransferase [Chitinophagales bacterium]
MSPSRFGQHIEEKIMTDEVLGERLQMWRRSGKTIVFTNGCFDLLHAGHLHLLHEARSLGDVLVVGLNSDASVNRLKPGRPVVSEGDRARLLAALEAVDAVVRFDDDTPLRLIEYIRPDVLVKGADYAPELVVGREQVLGYGGAVHLVPLLPGYSTSALVERIKAI